MKNLKVLSLVGLGSLVGANAFAAGAYDAITTGVSWSDAVTAAGVVAAALAAFLVFKKGARGVLGFIGR